MILIALVMVRFDTQIKFTIERYSTMKKNVETQVVTVGDYLANAVNIGPCTGAELLTNLGVVELHKSPYQPRINQRIDDMLVKGGDVINPLVLYRQDAKNVIILRGHRRWAYAQTDLDNIRLSAKVITAPLDAEMISTITLDHGEEKSLQRQELFKAYFTMRRAGETQAKARAKIQPTIEACFGTWAKLEGKKYVEFLKQNPQISSPDVEHLNRNEQVLWAQFRRTAEAAASNGTVQKLEALMYLPPAVRDAAVRSWDGALEEGALKMNDAQRFGYEAKFRVEFISERNASPKNTVAAAIEEVDLQINTGKLKEADAVKYRNFGNWLATLTEATLPAVTFGYSFADIDAKIAATIASYGEEKTKDGAAGEDGEDGEAGGGYKVDAAKLLATIAKAGCKNTERMIGAMSVLQHILGKIDAVELMAHLDAEAVTVEAEEAPAV